MKKAMKPLAILLVILLTVPFFAISASAVIGYPMTGNIYYVNESGTTVAPTKTFTFSASDPDSCNFAYASPSVAGYALKNNSDAVVTYSMMDKYFPASNYVRQGGASYTVVYVPTHTHTVKYLYSWGTTCFPDAYATAKQGVAYAIYSPSKTDYTPDRSVVTGTIASTDTSSTVKYYINTATLSYSANGGSGAPPSETRYVTFEDPISYTKPTRTGYTFLGWSKSSSATTASYAPGDYLQIKTDTTLYAVWSRITYTISYDANGGSGAPGNQTKYHGTGISLSSVEPTRDHYAFLGWSENATANVADFYPGYWWTDNRSAMLYAIWERIPEEYTVTYNANGGSGAPASQIKYEDVNLLLSTEEPTRDGYDYMGWSERANTTLVDYYPSETYTENRSLNLYAVWDPHTYTVTYHANGGDETPSAQIKTHDIPLRLRDVTPSRDRYDFLGWSTAADATEPVYYPGDILYDEGDLTLYAVWRYINYDFSVSSLTYSPTPVYQFNTVTVRFRIDSWDRYHAYENVPIEVLFGSTTVYQTTVDIAAYGVQYVTMDLNVGAVLGKQQLTARINWPLHDDETRTQNNEASTNITVRKWFDLGSSTATPSGETYYAGTEVISSFLISNDGASDILPEDELTVAFHAWYEDDAGEPVTVASSELQNYVVPAGYSNLAWFRWEIPETAEGKLIWCTCTVNPDGRGGETDDEDNTSFYTILPQPIPTSDTPNTRYERTAPAWYDAGARAPTQNTGSATWDVWEYEDGGLVLKTYGFRISSDKPVLTPDPSCETAVYANSTWTMKSGYGFTLEWNPRIGRYRDYILPGENDYTPLIYASVRLPEYNYSTEEGKYITLDRMGNRFCLPENADTLDSARVHFIPVYVADGNYIVSAALTQLWTPAGMMTVTRQAKKVILDGTIYDDHYVGQ